MTGTIGMFAGHQPEARRLHALAEVAGIVGELATQLVAGLDQIEHGQRGGRDHRRDGIREQVGARTLAQPVDDLGGAGDVSARRAAQCLAQSARQQIDPAHDLLMLVRAAALGADEAGGVRIIDRHDRPVTFRERADLRQAVPWCRPSKTRRR